MSKPPGKDEDGNDIPPLPPKEKARRQRMLFVDRVQELQQACMSELSQSSSLKRTRAQASKRRVHPAMLYVERQNQEVPTQGLEPGRLAAATLDTTSIDLVHCTNPLRGKTGRQSTARTSSSSSSSAAIQSPHRP